MIIVDFPGRWSTIVWYFFVKVYTLSPWVLQSPVIENPVTRCPRQVTSSSEEDTSSSGQDGGIEKALRVQTVGGFGCLGV